MSTERVWKKPEEDVVGELEFIRPSKLGDEHVDKVLLEGTFIESIPNHFDNTKNDFKFEKLDGGTVILNGAGNLGYRMRSIDPGQIVQITYRGMQEIQNGKMKGRLAHNFDVLVGD